MFILRWQTLVGGLIGLLFGTAILALTGSLERQPVPSGPILSECDGHLRELVLQYEPAAKNIVVPVYRDFLRALDPDVRIHLVCPDRAAFDDFLATIGDVGCRVTPILAGHAMTAWSRDRWVALTPATPNGPTTLWSPRGEAGQEFWPARAGDERIGRDIATALAPLVRAQRSALYFDGGDFLADHETVFVMPRILQRNIQQTVPSREALLNVLSRELKRRVILLDEAPDHHAGMFMASVGSKTMLVGDLSLARELISSELGQLEQGPTNAIISLPGGPDFTAATQHLFDAVAAQCVAAGYRVIRIPVVPARDGRTYLTYVNVSDRSARRPARSLPSFLPRRRAVECRRPGSLGGPWLRYPPRRLHDRLPPLRLPALPGQRPEARLTIVPSTAGASSRAQTSSERLANQSSRGRSPFPNRQL